MLQRWEKELESLLEKRRNEFERKKLDDESRYLREQQGISPPPPSSEDARCGSTSEAVVLPKKPLNTGSG